MKQFEMICPKALSPSPGKHTVKMANLPKRNKHQGRKEYLHNPPPILDLNQALLLEKLYNKGIVGKRLLCKASALLSCGDDLVSHQNSPSVPCNLWPGPALSPKHHMRVRSPAKTHPSPHGLLQWPSVPEPRAGCSLILGWFSV